jgi:iron complex outermembrane receptor protein
MLRSLCGCAATWSAIFALPASAQADPADGDIVVTGTRQQGYLVSSTSALGLPVELSRLPASVSVLSDALLEDLGARTLANVLPYVAGVSNADNGGVNTDEFVIRGFPNANNFINGIRNSLTAEGRPALETVERVEIVKGPSGVEGSVTAPGGFVNIITKKPQPTFAAELFGSIGDFGFRRLGADVTGPLVGEALTGRLIASYENRQHWRPGRTNRPIFTLAPSLNWRIGERTNLLVEYELRRQNDPLDRGTIHVRGAVPGSDFLPRDFSFHQRVDSLDLTNQRLDVDFTHRFAEGLEARLHYQRVGQTDRQIATRNADSEAGGTLFATDGLGFSGDPVIDIFTGTSGSRLDAEVFVGELRGEFAAGTTRHAVVAGGSRARNTDRFGSLDGDFLSREGAVPYNVLAPTDRLTRDQLGLGPDGETAVFADFVRGDRITSGYVQWLGTWTERFRTVVSVRHDAIDTFAREDIEGIAPDVLDRGIGQGTVDPDALFSEESSERVLSARIAGSFDLSDALTAFVGHARTGEPQPGFTRTGDAIGTIRNTSWEGGLRLRIAEGRALASITAYRISQANIAIADPLNTPQESFLVPLGSARISGLEFELVGKLTDTLSIFSGLSLQDSEITQSGEAIVGNRFANVPRFQASAFVNWNAADVGLDRLDIGLGVSHQGERQANSGNEYQLPAYTRVDLGISYAVVDGLDARLQLNNIFDVTYFTAAQDSIFGSDQVGVGDRRLVQFSVTKRF